MDGTTKQRLIDFALSLEEFRNLHPKEQKWLRPLLSRSFESTLKILELISDREMTFKEIALELGLNYQTVMQKINGLKAGGMDITITGYSAIAHTGRPRHLLRQVSLLK